MKIILLKDVKDVGKKGNIVAVKSGYARHKLIPTGVAIQYTDSAVKQAEELNRMELVRQNKKRRAEIQLKEALEKLSLTRALPCGEDGKPFGAVTNIDIEKLLKKEGYEIERKNILLEKPIKELGVYAVAVTISAETEATVRIWVVRE